MIKKLWPHARPYGGWIILGIACSAGEAIFELLIPLVMSDIVNIGIPNADETFILANGFKMVLMALVSLALGAGAAICSSIAGQGYHRKRIYKEGLRFVKLHDIRAPALYFG